MDDVVDPFRHARVVHDLAQKRRSMRCFLGRFDHNGIAQRQRRTDLPGHQQQRQIPWADDCDNPFGACHTVVDRLAAVGGIGLEKLGAKVFDHVGEGREIRPPAWNINDPR